VPRQQLREFDRRLLEASEAEFREFIEEAQSLSTLGLELLLKGKELVDARVAAEPESKVFSLNDRDVVRMRYWVKISERFGAEINFRRIRTGLALPMLHRQPFLPVQPIHF
jgi:hypothetical protein